MAQVLEAGERPAVELGTDECPYPPMVSFEQPDGGSEAFPYDALMSVRYDPSGAVKVRFTTDTVTLRGRNLLTIWGVLRSGRARLLRVAAETDGVQLDQDEPHIDSITVTPLPLKN